MTLWKLLFCLLCHKQYCSACVATVGLGHGVYRKFYTLIGINVQKSLSTTELDKSEQNNSNSNCEKLFCSLLLLDDLISNYTKISSLSNSFQ